MNTCRAHLFGPLVELDSVSHFPYFLPAPSFFTKKTLEMVKTQHGEKWLQWLVNKDTLGRNKLG